MSAPPLRGTRLAVAGEEGGAARGHAPETSAPCGGEAQRAHLPICNRSRLAALPSDPIGLLAGFVTSPTAAAVCLHRLTSHLSCSPHLSPVCPFFPHSLDKLC